VKQEEELTQWLLVCLVGLCVPEAAGIPRTEIRINKSELCNSVQWAVCNVRRRSGTSSPHSRRIRTADRPAGILFAQRFRRVLMICPQGCHFLLIVPVVYLTVVNYASRKSFCFT
jgi:hypothetical protein